MSNDKLSMIPLTAGKIKQAAEAALIPAEKELEDYYVTNIDIFIGTTYRFGFLWLKTATIQNRDDALSYTYRESWSDMKQWDILTFKRRIEFLKGWIKTTASLRLDEEIYLNRVDYDKIFLYGKSND